VKTKSKKEEEKLISINSKETLKIYKEMPIIDMNSTKGLVLLVNSILDEILEKRRKFLSSMNYIKKN
jgi:hypothetical protein